MKTFILFCLLALVSCGKNGEVAQPVVPPTVVNGNSKTVRYSATIRPRYCSLTITVNNQPLPYGTYSYSCEYDKNGNIKAFLVTYYLSIPSLAFLNYPLY